MGLRQLQLLRELSLKGTADLLVEKVAIRQSLVWLLQRTKLKNPLRT